MKNQLLFFLVLILSSLSGANASVIRGAESAISNVGDFGSDYGITNAIDQTGLYSTYENGVTDFDFFTSLLVKHSFLGENDWFSEPGTGNSAYKARIEFDLGNVFSIDRIAIWNDEYYGVGSIKISFATSADFTENFFTIADSFEITDNTRAPDSIDPSSTDYDYLAQIIDLGGFINASHVRFDMTGVYSAGIGLGEVAFSTNKVPEPSLLALLAIGLFGLGFVRRKK